jgi:hypothetical protein
VASACTTRINLLSLLASGEVGVNADHIKDLNDVAGQFLETNYLPFDERRFAAYSEIPLQTELSCSQELYGAHLKSLHKTVAVRLERP